MIRHFYDYIWKDGVPKGTKECSPDATDSCRVVTDPYRKRISVEKYASGNYLETVYDSQLLDFRHLKPMYQKAWRKVTREDTPQEILNLIYDQDDRVVYYERCHFEEGLCRRCEVTTPYGYLLSVHQMLYEKMGDPWNGVILFDRNEHPVMRKKYRIDTQTHEFTDLIEESWEA